MAGPELAFTRALPVIRRGIAHPAPPGRAGGCAARGRGLVPAGLRRVAGRTVGARADAHALATAGREGHAGHRPGAEEADRSPALFAHAVTGPRGRPYRYRSRQS